MSYSNKEVDDETTLSYFEARYLNREAGRFISQDPWAGDLTDPQSLNKYAYARNNPISYVDHDGNIAILAALWAMAETAFTAWDIADTYNAWTSSTATVKDKVVTTGFLALGIVGPGGGYGHIDDAAKVGKKIATDPVGVVNDIGGAIKGSAENASELAKKYNWSSGTSLQKHFDKHKVEFSFNRMSDYASAVNDMYKKGMTQVNSGIRRWVDDSGIIRMSDESNNNFGSFNSDGSVRTFFKPKSGSYVERNSKDWGREIIDK